MSFSRLQNDSATFRWDFNMCDLFFVVWMSLWLFSLPCKHYNIMYKRNGCYSPLTPCSTAWVQVRLPLFMSTRSCRKIEVIPVWIHKLPRLQQMRKLQDLENSRSCRQDLESSNSCRQDLENSRSCRQDLESSRSCRQDLESSNSCRKDLENARSCRQDLESSNSCRKDLENSRSCRKDQLAGP